MIVAEPLQEGEDDADRPSPVVLSEGEAPSDLPPHQEEAEDTSVPDEADESPEEQLPRRSKSTRENKRARLPIDYIPISLFLVQCLFSFGLYPYVWLLRRIDSFPDSGEKGLDRAGMEAHCVVGFCVQLLMPCAISACVWAWLTPDDLARKLAAAIVAAYVLSYILLVLPGRCFHHFGIRWRLRRAVAEWDEGGVMIDRTMTSLPRLFLFGSAYMQYHLNRLIGIGMPGFSGYEEIAGDFSVTGAVKDYLRAGPK